MAPPHRPRPGLALAALALAAALASLAVLAAPAGATPPGAHTKAPEEGHDHPAPPGGDPGFHVEVGEAEAQALALGFLAAGGAFVVVQRPRLELFAAPLFSRIARDEALDQGTRERIYRLVREQPGIHANAIARALDLRWSTAVYHLNYLERQGLLASRAEGRARCFFVVGDRLAPLSEALAAVRHPTARAVAGAVARQPGIVQRALCEELGLSSALASWHLQRLAAAQVVVAARQGRWTHYAPGPAWAQLAAAGEVEPAAVAPPSPMPPASAGPSNGLAAMPAAPAAAPELAIFEPAALADGEPAQARPEGRTRG